MKGRALTAPRAGSGASARDTKREKEKALWRAYVHAWLNDFRKVFSACLKLAEFEK